MRFDTGCLKAGGRGQERQPPTLNRMAIARRLAAVTLLLWTWAANGVCGAEDEEQHVWRWDMTMQEYRAAMAELRGGGYRPISVDASGPVSNPRFAAVWCHEGFTDWVAREGLSAEEYEAEFKRLSRKGLSPLCVDAYGTYPQERYVAVWVRRMRACTARHRLTSSEYQDVFEDLVSKGYVPTWVSVSGSEPHARFVAIWVKSDGVARGVHGRDEANYAEVLQDFRDDGYRPLCQSVYGQGEDRRFASVWTRALARDWQAAHGQSPAAFSAFSEQMSQRGYHPVSVSAHGSPSGRTYSSVWLENDVSRTWRVSGERVGSLDSFDEVVKHCMKLRGVSRAALAVSKGSRLVLARGYTWAPEDAPATAPDALFRIASVSKPITAVGVLRLVDDGKLGLDQKVAEIIDLSGAVDRRIRDVTVRHLLQHWGGWDADASFDPMFRDRHISEAVSRPLPTTPQMVIEYMKGHALDHAPGAKMAYSNFGYCLLGRVIEAVSGRGYEEYIRREVLATLEITRMRIGKSLKADRREGEVAYEDARGRIVESVMGASGPARVPLQYGGWNLATMDAHGGWIASAEDLVRFACAFDEPHNCPVLSENMLDIMWSPPPWGDQHSDVFYGCGWNVRRVGDGMNTWHAGKLSPGSSSLLVRRHDGLNWAILFNCDHEPLNMSVEGDIDRMLHVAANRVVEWPQGVRLSDR